MVLRDDSGNEIIFDDQGGEGNNSRIIYSATYSGTYFIEASGYLNLFAGTYSLTSQIIDDFANNADTTGLLEIGDSSSGELEEKEDSDWFSINLQSGMTYQFDLRVNFRRCIFISKR